MYKIVKEISAYDTEQWSVRKGDWCTVLHYEEDAENLVKFARSAHLEKLRELHDECKKHYTAFNKAEAAMLRMARKHRVKVEDLEALRVLESFMED